ncbi:rhomboid family intramembrane serine protease [Lapidilactobacillus salsurivasis]
MRRRRFFTGNWVTVLLLAFQVAIFIGETAAGGSESAAVLYQFGAKINVSVQAGEWWRLLTPMFVHIGWMHLLVNSATLYYIGGSVEQMIGHWRYLVIYLLSGITGNLMSFAFGAMNSISAGASTALFGLFGVYIALGVVFRDDAYLRATGRQFAMLAVFNFVFDLIAQGIDLWGHFGGLIGGFLLLLVFPLPGQRRRQGRIVQICAIIGYFVICAFLYRLGMVR